MLCPVCNGIGSISGFWLGSVKTCTSCHGKGKLHEDLDNLILISKLQRRVNKLEDNQIKIMNIIERLIKIYEK